VQGSPVGGGAWGVHVRGRGTPVNKRRKRITPEMIVATSRLRSLFERMHADVTEAEIRRATQLGCDGPAGNERAEAVRRREALGANPSSGLP
jgi:hypothetical protein